MIVEHDHRKATPSHHADMLEMEIETIERSIIKLTHEILNRLASKIVSRLREPKIALFIGVFMLFQLIRLSFTKQASFKRQISRLNSRNCKLKNQNKRLQYLLSRSKKELQC